MKTFNSLDEYLALGLRNRWHPVLSSWEIEANPVGITRLGENLVLWRDDAGDVHPRCRGRQNWDSR